MPGTNERAGENMTSSKPGGNSLPPDKSGDKTAAKPGVGNGWEGTKGSRHDARDKREGRREVTSNELGGNILPPDKSGGKTAVKPGVGSGWEGTKGREQRGADKGGAEKEVGLPLVE